MEALVAFHRQATLSSFSLGSRTERGKLFLFSPPKS